MAFDYKKEFYMPKNKPEIAHVPAMNFIAVRGTGKSTLQKILLGMLPGYEGSVVVNGTQCNKCGSDFYENIGVDFEYSTMYEKLYAKENLLFFSSLYRRKAGHDRQLRSIDELLCMVGLENDADKRVSDYSKGMKSRLNFIKALVHDPKLLFLDEPTSGLDPTNSRLMKDMILGAVVPYFVPKPVCYCLSILPSFWIGKAVLESALIWMFPGVFVAGIWIWVLIRVSYRKV